MLTHMTIFCQFSTKDITHFTGCPLSREQPLFFDIETTGLSHRNSRVYLIGAAGFLEGEYRLYQFMAEKDTDEEEKAVLEAFQSLCSPAAHLIHYNGTTFDIPYLLHRYRAHHLDSSLPVLSSTDLYRRLLPFKPLFLLPNFKLKTTESFSGFQRKDTLSGRELIFVYHKYCQNKDETLLSQILLHNHDDIQGMLSLLTLGNLIALFSGDFQEPACTRNVSKQLDGTTFSELIFTVKLGFSFPSPLSCMMSGHIYIRIFGSLLQMKIPVQEGTLCHFYKDYKNYFYLPKEDEAIHKSVGIYVDRAFREKAKASNCYKKIKGSFLPLPSPQSFDALKASYDSPDCYLLLTDAFLADAPLQKRYLASILAFYLRHPG